MDQEIAQAKQMINNAIVLLSRGIGNGKVGNLMVRQSLLEGLSSLNVGLQKVELAERNLHFNHPD